MIVCDLFELKLTLCAGDRPKLEYLFYTDLPAGPQVILSCHRTYLDIRGETCVWSGFDERLELLPNVLGDYAGGKGSIDVHASDREAQKWFNGLNGPFSAGIKTRVGNELTVTVTLGGRQRLRAFGKNNAALSGQMVHRAGELNVVQVSAMVVNPMAEAYQPLSL